LHISKKSVPSDAALLTQFPRKYVRVFIKMHEVLGKIRAAPSHATICC